MSVLLNWRFLFLSENHWNDNGNSGTWIFCDFQNYRNKNMAIIMAFRCYYANFVIIFFFSHQNVIIDCLTNHICYLQTSSTTEASTTTTTSTTTVAPAPAPTPAPGKPSEGKYVVTNGTKSCILLQFAAQLNVTYVGKWSFCCFFWLDDSSVK